MRKEIDRDPPAGPEEPLADLESPDDSLDASSDTSVDGGLLDAEVSDEPTIVDRRLTGPPSAGAGSRIGGLLALLLGIVGSALMVLAAAMVIRFGFTASSTVDRVIEPVRLTFDRMDTRIDETDDLVNRDGIPADRVDELQARVDGLVDVSIGANQVFETIQGHPIYSLLPAELSTLGDALAEFEKSAISIDRRLGTASDGATLDAPVAAAVADELDGMQGRVSEVRDMISSAGSSLRRWIRLGALLAFIGSLWGLWGQISLARRGWRGFRGQQK